MKKLIVVALLAASVAVLMGAGRHYDNPVGTQLVLTLDSNRGNNHVDSLSYDSGYVDLVGDIKDYSSMQMRFWVSLPRKGSATADSFYQTSALSKDTIHLFLYSTLGDSLYFIDSTVLTNLPKTWDKRILKIVGDSLLHSDLRLKWRMIDTTSVIDSTLKANATWPKRYVDVKYNLIFKE